MVNRTIRLSPDCKRKVIRIQRTIFFNFGKRSHFKEGLSFFLRGSWRKETKLEGGRVRLYDMNACIVTFLLWAKIYRKGCTCGNPSTGRESHLCIGQ